MRHNLLTATALIASLIVGFEYAPSSRAYGQTTNNRAFSICRNEVEHKKLYSFGEKLAEGWVHFKKLPDTDEKKFPTKTRSSFMLRALRGFLEKYKITDTNDKQVLYNCYIAYYATADSRSWSSVHQGMIDYLPAPDKARFMSLPER
jgi:hypothetical protein